MAAARFSDRIDVAFDNEVSGAHPVDVIARDPELGALGELDEPFADEEALLPQFVAELRARGVGDAYLPAFTLEARAFRARFGHVAAERLDAEMLEMYVEEARLRSLPERALRNRRVGVQSYLEFLQRRHATQSPAPELTIAEGVPGEKRRDPRVPFLADVQVDNFGMKRSADISVGGIYLERLTTAACGTSLCLRFKLRSTDPEPITAVGRVTFVHPQFGAGLEFVSMAPEDSDRIADLVARIGASEPRRSSVE